MIGKDFEKLDSEWSSFFRVSIDGAGFGIVECEGGREANGPKGAIRCRLALDCVFVLASVLTFVVLSPGVVVVVVLPNDESKSFNCLDDGPAFPCPCILVVSFWVVPDSFAPRR
jgi:hypothetical protein